MTDYSEAKILNLTNIDRWGLGMDHHPMSERIVEFLSEHDLHDYNDSFCWKTGGDGDNGETLMFQLDAFFEYLDMKEKYDKPMFYCRDCVYFKSGLSMPPSCFSPKNPPNVVFGGFMPRVASVAHGSETCQYKEIQPKNRWWKL